MKVVEYMFKKVTVSILLNFFHFKGKIQEPQECSLKNPKLGPFPKIEDYMHVYTYM